MLETRGFSLVTWNILAPSYAPATKYPWASADHLSWSARRGRIIERLASMDADAVCLQEVECVHWDDLAQRFHALGYESVLQQTQTSQPIANAVLLKKGRLRCVRSESRSRALITVVEGAQQRRSAPTPPPLYLANVHLEAGSERAAQSQRLLQVRSLLRRIEVQRARDVAAANGRPRTLSPATDAPGAPLVLAGDFNSDRSSRCDTSEYTSE